MGQSRGKDKTALMVGGFFLIIVIMFVIAQMIPQYPPQKIQHPEHSNDRKKIQHPEHSNDTIYLHSRDQRPVNKLGGSATALTFHELEEFYKQIQDEDTDLALWQQECSPVECAKPHTKLAIVVPFIPNQLDKVKSYLHTGLVIHQPCSSGFMADSGADLVFTVRHQQDLDGIQQSLQQLLAAVDLRCFRGVYLTHAKLNERESNDYDVGPPAYFHNTLNSSWLMHGDTGAGYSHMYWMEPDTLPVKDGWLEWLHKETQQMQAQGVWMRGSLQQHNMKMYGDLDRYHVNGNALYSVGSKPFRTFLRHARRYVPTDVTAFDYAIYVWRSQAGAADKGHAYITQMVHHKFQETATISNHPADLCPSLRDWTRRHPLARVVHGNQVLQLLEGSKCCESSADSQSFDVESRAETELSAAYDCLKKEMKAAWAVHVDDGNYERKTGGWKDEKTASELEYPISVPFVPLWTPDGVAKGSDESEN